jgi:hypothetical protein
MRSATLTLALAGLLLAGAASALAVEPAANLAPTTNLTVGSDLPAVVTPVRRWVYGPGWYGYYGGPGYYTYRPYYYYGVPQYYDYSPVIPYTGYYGDYYYPYRYRYWAPGYYRY